MLNKFKQLLSEIDQSYLSFIWFVIKLIFWVVVLFFALPFLAKLFISLFQINIQLSDFILLITAAFIVAYTYETQEMKKQMISKTDLELCFHNEPSFSHMTKTEGGQPVYYFSLQVINKGTKQAKNCEVVLEEISIKDKNGKWIKENYMPVNLKWVAKDNPQFISINPGRKIYCNIGHIYSIFYKPQWSFMPNEDNGKLLFNLDLMTYFYYQRDYLPPGEFKIKISVYCENAKVKEKIYYLKWTGQWKPLEEEMLNKEIIIR